MIARQPADLKRVACIRQEIMELLVIDYNGCTFTGEELDYLIQDLRPIFPRSTEVATLRACVVYLLGQQPSQESMELMAWRLGGNYHRIAHHRTILPWRCQSSDEWVPAYIDQARPYVTKAGKRGNIFRFKILSGFTAGLHTEQFWSDSFCRFVSRDYGFSRRGKGPKFRQANQLVLLRFMLRISASKSIDRPVFEGVMTPAPSNLKKWNREISIARMRMVDQGRCPSEHQRPVSLPCYMCDIGFNACSNGTHKLRYIQRYCMTCNTDDAWMNPEFSDTICLKCLARVRLPQTQRAIIT